MKDKPYKSKLQWDDDPRTILYGPPPLERRIKTEFRFESVESSRCPTRNSMRALDFLQEILRQSECTLGGEQ